MCLMHDLHCDCERRVLSAYRKQRTQGRAPNAAYAVAVQTFQHLHPTSGAFVAMGAVKNALASEIEIGIVDSGDVVGRSSGHLPAQL